jgi:hypothetical protein
VVGNEISLQKALLVLLTTSDLSAQRLGGGDGLFKGLASRNELVESAIRQAYQILSAPEQTGIAELFSQHRGATREIQRLSMVSL